MQRLTRQVHPSWLIMWPSVGCLAGIALAALLHQQLSGTVWVVAASSLLVPAFMKRTVAAIVLVLVAGLILGIWRGGFEQDGLSRYRAFYGKNVILAGTVSDDASLDSQGNQLVVVKDVSLNGSSMNGQIWLGSDNVADIRRCDHIVVKGKLGAGFGSIAASMFHAIVVKISRPQPGDIGLQIRDWFASGIRVAIPEPEASLASGYLVGQRSTLPEDLSNQLKTAGLTLISSLAYRTRNV